MSANTSIGWTDHTFNPWWGCVRVSPGCEHCYAETFSKRVGQKVWGPAKTTERRLFGDKHWNEPLKWEQKAVEEGRRYRVFCASMADVFEDHPQLPEQRKRLWALIEATPHLDWQLLTKRPENVLLMMAPEFNGGIPDNVWIGASAENQEMFNKRVVVLRQIPATVRFLSCEPLIGQIDPIGNLKFIEWVIVGGESGPGARPMNTEWADLLVYECQSTETSVYVKQLGKFHGKKGDAKAEDWTRWPNNLRVRQFPARPLT